MIDGRQARRALIVLVLAGVVARLAFAALPRVIRWDEPDYLWLGRNLVTGEGYRVAAVPDLHYPPLIPLLFGPFTLWLDELEHVGELWYVLCGALLPLPVFALARRIYGRRVALGAAILTAAFPLLTISPLYWGTMSEPPFLLLLFAGIDRAHAACRAGPGVRGRSAFLAAVALAFAYLARPEGILHLALAGGWLLATGLSYGAWRGRDRRRAVALFVLGALLVAGPYLLYLRLETGRFMLTGKTGLTLDLWEGVIESDPAAYDRAVASLDAAGEEILWYSPERFTRPGLVARLLAEPEVVLERIGRNARSLGAGLFGRWLALVPVALLALAGAILAWRRGRAGDQLFLAAMALPPFAFVAIFIQVRFFAPVAPILLIWVAAALDAAGELAAERLGRPRLAALPIALVTAGLLALWPPVLARGRSSLDFGDEQVGLWLRDHAPPGAVIMARDPAIPLYAERGFCPFPHAPYDQVLAYARARGASLWATSRRELVEVKPPLAPLADPARRPPGLKLVYTQKSAGDTRMVFALPEANAPR